MIATYWVVVQGKNYVGRPGKQRPNAILRGGPSQGFGGQIGKN